jgi:hypothetical protein
MAKGKKAHRARGAADAGPRRQTRILFVVTTSLNWSKMRGHGYATLHDYIDALRNWGASVEVVPTTFLETAAFRFEPGEFDQVWLSDLIGIYFGTPRYHEADSAFWGRVSQLAPVRVGYETETLVYEGEIGMAPDDHPESHLNRFLRRLPFVTHVLANDETVVDIVERADRSKYCLWSPVTVSEQWLDRAHESWETQHDAVFSGSLYGKRVPFYEAVSDVVSRVQTPEGDMARRYDVLVAQARERLKHLSVGDATQMRRENREVCEKLQLMMKDEFRRMLDTLGSGTIVVNFPSYTRGLVHRVVEGIAAGRPVATDLIPERPRTADWLSRSGFVLTYRSPEELRGRLVSAVGGRKGLRQMAEAGVEFMRREATTEIRIEECMRWIEQTNREEVATKSIELTSSLYEEERGEAVASRRPVDADETVRAQTRLYYVPNGNDYHIAQLLDGLYAQVRPFGCQDVQDYIDRRVLAYQTQEATSIMLNEVRVLQPDVVYVESGYNIEAEALEFIRAQFGIPVTMWFGDACVNQDFVDRTLQYAGKVDWQVVVDRRVAEAARQRGIDNVEFIPFFGYDHYFRPEPAEQDIDILFTGKSYGGMFEMFPMATERMAFVQRLDREFGRGLRVVGEGWETCGLCNYHAARLPEWEINGLNNRAKIVVSYDACRVQDFTSCRTYHALLSGAFVLIRKYPGIEKSFVNGEHLVWFETEDEGIELAKRYLANDAERETMAREGRKHVLDSGWVFSNVAKYLVDRGLGRETRRFEEIYGSYSDWGD